MHSTAIVEHGATLGQGVKIGPYAVIGKNVILGDHVQIGSHVVIKGRTQLGSRTRVWPFASIGTEPQDLKYQGEDTELICGEDNMIREYVNLSLGTQDGGGRTVIGSGNLFMVNTHIAHDCIVGDRCIFANGVSLGGHVLVQSEAVIGGHVAVHQFVRIGQLAMLAGGAIVVQDVPPFVMVHGNHASPGGLNLTGLRRSGRNRERIRSIKAMYKILYHSGKSLQDALELINCELEPSDDLTVFTEFCRHSGRGLCR
ncbi:MAG: acyl-ACP--UDP-N-acetylglucosamine O-acyltransferase [Deltaproteobacteria bacterium]|nr:acyl-ACP--UDP-N-acetylglucosamine O-acyltransferase [Deltaproteobacteria bacterium]